MVPGSPSVLVSHLAGPLSRQARTLRLLHTSIGLGELCCLGYLWFCALSRRRNRWLNLSAGVLAGEGFALLMAKGCPLGVFQRRAGDDVPMFELWFGPRLAPFAIPSFTVIAVVGFVLVLTRPPRSTSCDPQICAAKFAFLSGVVRKSGPGAIRLGPVG